MGRNMVFRIMRFRGVFFTSKSPRSLDQTSRTCFAERRTNRHRRNDYSILNIFIRFGDICRRTSKSSEIMQNFACFSPPKFFWSALPKILDRHYKIGPSTDHRAKFHAGRPTHLGDLALNKKTSCVKRKSFRKLSFSGGLINQDNFETFWVKMKITKKISKIGRKRGVPQF